MSYDAYENSIQDGMPVVLYLFVLGDTRWRYTSTDHDYMTPDGLIWKSLAIAHDNIRQSGEAASDAMNITLPISAGVVSVFLVTPPATVMQLAIATAHVGEDETRIVYAGEVTQVNPGQLGQATITVENTSASMKREGLRLGWQRSCPYALYDERTCRVDKSLYAKVFKMTAKLGPSIQTNGSGDPSIPADYFSGGFITWTHPVRGLEYRGITTHSGYTLGIFGSTDDMYEGLTITAYPGCIRDTATCKNKFNNLVNYGGIPHMPGTSPFDGNPVF